MASGRMRSATDHPYSSIFFDDKIGLWRVTSHQPTDLFPYVGIGRVDITSTPPPLRGFAPSPRVRKTPKRRRPTPCGKMSFAFPCGGFCFLASCASVFIRAIYEPFSYGTSNSLSSMCRVPSCHEVRTLGIALMLRTRTVHLPEITVRF